MRELDLAPIVERVRAATAPPLYETQLDDATDDDSPRARTVLSLYVDGSHWIDAETEQEGADVEFVAHAAEDVRALVDEVRKLRAIVERAREVVAFHRAEAAEQRTNAERYIKPSEPRSWHNARAAEADAIADRLEAALVDQCHHTDGEADCWHFGDRDGRDG
jgi:hypothetical protein